jgi:hypothetical protein
MSDQLEVLNPPEATVQFSGEDVTVTPIRMGKLQAFTKVVRPIVGDIVTALDGSGDMLTTIELHCDRMIEAVQIATGIERDKLDNALPDEFIGLAKAVIEINADFFARRLLPSIKTAVEGLQETVKTAAGQQ